MCHAFVVWGKDDDFYESPPKAVLCGAKMR